MQNMGAIMAEMQKLQSELRNKVIEVAEGNGAIVIKINGQQEVVGVTIAPDLLGEKNSEMLEVLIASAMNKAIAESKRMIKEEIAKKTGFAMPNWPDSI